MKKRLLAVLMCLCIAVSMIPGMAFAGDITLSYVALGDSITTGYGLANPGAEAFPKLVADEKGLSLENLAEVGATSADLLEVVTASENQEAFKNADVITITIGGNDLMNALYKHLTDGTPKRTAAPKLT